MIGKSAGAYVRNDVKLSTGAHREASELVKPTMYGYEILSYNYSGGHLMKNYEIHLVHQNGWYAILVSKPFLSYCFALTGFSNSTCLRGPALSGAAIRG